MWLTDSFEYFYRFSDKLRHKVFVNLSAPCSVLHGVLIIVCKGRINQVQLVAVKTVDFKILTIVAI